MTGDIGGYSALTPCQAGRGKPSGSPPHATPALAVRSRLLQPLPPGKKRAKATRQNGEYSHRLIDIFGIFAELRKQDEMEGMGKGNNQEFTT